MTSAYAHMSQVESTSRVQPWHGAVGLLVLCALIMFVPMSDPRLKYWSETVWHVTQDQMIPTEKIYEEFRQIESKALELSERGELTPELMFGFQKRLERMLVYAEQNGPNPRPGHIADGMMRIRLSNIRDGFKAFRKLPEEDIRRYQSFFDTDPEWLALKSFRASTSTGAIWTPALLRYVLTIPLWIAVCFLLLLQMEKSPGHALGVVSGHPIWMAFYPFGLVWIFLQNESRRESMRRVLSMLSYGLAASISIFCGGTASAQTAKKDGKKKEPSHTLQLDTRIIQTTDGPPSPATIFNRTSVGGKTWLTDSITTFTPSSGSWYHETGYGRKVIRTARTTLSVNVMGSKDSKGVKKVMAGIEYFRSGPTYVIAIPVIRAEKTLGGPLAWSVAPNPFFRLGREGIRSRLALAPDGIIRKTLGKPLVWTAGLGFDVFLRKGKGDRVEAAVLRTSAHQWQLRGRWIHNFAY